MVRDGFISLLSCMLILFSTACENRIADEEPINRMVVLQMQTKEQTFSTRAYLSSGPNVGIPIGVCWNDDDKVKVFLRQDEKIHDLGEWPLEGISSDGKVAYAAFRVPGQINLARPYEVYGICHYFDTKVTKDSNGKDIVRGTFTHTNRYEWVGGLENWREVPWCFETTMSQNRAAVEVKQLAAYEFIHLKNATDDTHATYLTKIEADDCWFYKTFIVQFPGSIVTGENEGFITEEFRIHNGFHHDWNETVACYSMYLPNGKRPTNVRFHFRIDKKEYVTPARSANIDLLPGHAYHYWHVYNGNSVTYDKDHYAEDPSTEGELDDVPGYEL